MNSTEARKLWADALRSGEYKQGQGYLKATDRYCCLGVACEVYQKHVGDLSVSETGPESDSHTRFDLRSNMLPMKVARWLDVDAAGTLASDENNALWWLNDTCRQSFVEIAAVIDSGDLVAFDPANWIALDGDDGVDE